MGGATVERSQSFQAQEKLGRTSEILVAGVVLLVVLMMVLPLPPVLLDLLLALNISVSLFVLLLTMEVSSPLSLPFSFVAFNFNPFSLSTECLLHQTDFAHRRCR